MNDFKMDDYIDVAERIIEFRTKHPEGSLQQRDLQFIDFAGKSWVVFTAQAYRSADDQRPGEGTAWELVPGATPFTRGSEVQNAETAAWGRAIVAVLAADTKRGIASKQEIRAAERRRTPDQDDPWAMDPDDPRPITDNTRKRMFALFGQKGIAEADQLPGINSMLGKSYGSRGDLTEADGQRVIAVVSRKPDAAKEATP